MQANNYFSDKKNKLLLSLALFLVTLSSNAVEVWGTATNGLRLGIEMVWGKNQTVRPPLCILHMQNVGTNVTGVLLPKPDSCYNIQLYGPNGEVINRKSSWKFSDAERARWETFKANEINQITYFSISNVFQPKINGRYELVISVRVSIWPDGGKSTYWGKHTYFALPPVTNSFDIISSHTGG
jgi:hypothetical protein